MEIQLGRTALFCLLAVGSVASLSAAPGTEIRDYCGYSAGAGKAVNGPGESCGVHDTDPYIWLSDNNPKALQWVSEQDAKSNAVLTKDPRYDTFRSEILKSLDTKDRIPTGEVIEGNVYNF